MQVTRDQSGQVLHLSGELSIDSAQELKDALQLYLRCEGPLRLDLAGVTDCDTAALQLLISAHKTAAAAGRELEITGLPSEIKALNTAIGVTFFETSPAGGVHGAA